MSGGTRRCRWERHNALKRGAEASHEQAEGRIELSEAVRGHVHEADVAWLEELARAAEITPGEAKHIAFHLAWLRACATRTLSPDWRANFRKLARRIERKRDGTYVPPTQEMIEQGKKRQALRAMRRAERRAPPPAWSLDPSLLPKRPPGRAAGGT